VCSHGCFPFIEESSMLTSRARRALGVVHPLPHALAAELACKIHGEVLNLSDHSRNHPVF